MSFNSKMNFVAFTILATTLASGSAFAAGFEKAMNWSAASVGQAGAVVGTVSGADALYFNPAGLSTSNGAMGDVSFNFSPTFAKFSGANPYQNSSTTAANNLGSVDGKQTFSPVIGILGSYKINSQLGIGAGFYVAGGTRSKYEGLNYANVSAGVPYTISPTVETDLAIKEAAIGAGYEVMPGLRFGAAWRVIMVDAKFSTVSAPAAGGSNPNVAIANVNIDDIKATRWNAFKLGMQYDSEGKHWGMGANYRSGVNFIAKGTTSGTSNTAAGTVSTLSAGNADLSNAFPQQFALGGYYKVTNTLRVSPEYSYTNYSKNEFLGLTGTVGTSSLSAIPQHWKNQHVIRLGFECTGYSMPIRFGYAYTSQVTPNDFARSTFASPGPGHSIVAGSSYPLMTNMDLDFAGEYSFAKGTAHNDIAPNAAKPEVPADYEFKTRAYAAHLSVKYAF